MERGSDCVERNRSERAKVASVAEWKPPASPKSEFSILRPLEIDREGFIEVGRVTGLHGVRGKVKAAAFSGDPSGMLAARKVWLAGGRGADTGVREHEVVTAHRAGGCAVFSLKGIDTLKAAEGLVGAVVSVRRDELPPLPEDEFYWADLVGCALVDEGGSPLGEVAAVEPGPGHDWLVVRREGREEGYLPVVAAFIRSVDAAARRVVASPPEGW
jgi:16S rRNA processing protein RimM